MNNNFPLVIPHLMRDLYRFRVKPGMTKLWPLTIVFLVVVVFFWKFFFKGLLPIPADTIVGMYHPWRDVVWDNLTAGVPFKNFLTTDPVRQQYPWRQLAVSLLKKGQIPLWNPYTHAGTPLLASLQGAVFYPLNILFWALPFNFAWGILIFLQPLLAGIFLYLYLRQLKLKKIACFLGALSFAFSGFFIAWLEWGTVLHSALWLPLILLSIDKIIGEIGKIRVIWGVILIFSLSASFFAGHLQTSFYLVLFSIIYLAWRFSHVKKNRFRLITLFIILYSLFIILTSVQWLPTLRFIRFSARGLDQIDWQKPGWFIPFKHLVQFLAPDFFGNPATLNYWGEWNYAEFVGFIGVIPLILAFYALFRRREKVVLFFGFLVLLFLSFSLPTPWAKLPYQLGIPFISTSQPTRLLFLVDFCLAILAALGLDGLIEQLEKRGKSLGDFGILGLLGVLYGVLWGLVLLGPRIWAGSDWVANLVVSKRNLILPTGMFFAFVGLQALPWLVLLKRSVLQDLTVRMRIPKIFGSGISRFGFLKDRPYKKITLSAILLLTTFDLLRFSWKFTPFVKNDWLFPSTKTIEFLESDRSIFRFMSTDRRLLPPNFSLAYKLQTVDGYDPLYLRRYGELIAASERGEPNISPPFGFNRIITPQNYNSRIIDLLNVKYILSLTDLDSPKLDLVYREGETRVYENKNVFPRAFIVYDYQVVKGKQEAINLLMDEKINLAKVAILEEFPTRLDLVEGENKVRIREYRENEVVIDVKTNQAGILVLTDSYYPGWKAQVDEKEVEIYRANYNFRAVVVPEVKSVVIFKYDPRREFIVASPSFLGRDN